MKKGTQTGSKLKNSAKTVGAVLGGLALGSFAMKKIPGNAAKYVATAAGLLGPFFVSNKDFQIVLATVGAIGGAKVIKDMTDGKTGFLSTVNSAIPTLSGTSMGHLGTTTSYGRLGRLGNALNPATPMNITRSLTGIGMGNISMMDSELANALS